MYRTVIENKVGAGIVIRREHSTNPEVVPYKLCDEACFPDEEKSFRILEASNLTALPTENGVEFRQQ